MKVVTTEEMRRLEGLAGEHGVSVAMLMENAGRAVAEKIHQNVGSLAGKHIVVLVGPGNNGGDGLVAARHLHQKGARVAVFLFQRRAGEDPPLEALRQSGLVPMGGDLAMLKEALHDAHLVLDALLGTGQGRPLEGELRQALCLVREERERRPGLQIVALDLPSGLNADTGASDPSAVAADHTVTLGFPKRGLFLFPGAHYVGELAVVDIGIPAGLEDFVAVRLLTAEWARRVLPQRPKDANKGSFGRVLVVGGCRTFLGAPCLAAMGALRVGAGLVTLACPESLLPIIAAKVMEATFLPLPEEEPGYLGPRALEELAPVLPQYQALVLGCGLGQHPTTFSFMKTFLFASSQRELPRLVIDADGLNLLARSPQWWQRLPQEATVTPHPGEMARLAGTSVAAVQADRLGQAQKAARQWQKVVVLKGAHTIIAPPQGETLLSPFANPGLASGGTGDVLAGVIGGLLAQGLAPVEAAACGTYLHALAGEQVRASLGEAGMVAGDLLLALPQAIKGLRTSTTVSSDC